MVKLKQKDNGSFTLKGLDYHHLELIGALLYHVRLGSTNQYKDAAYEVSEALSVLDDHYGEDEWQEYCRVGYSLSVDDGFVIELEDTNQLDTDIELRKAKANTITRKYRICNSDCMKCSSC